MSCHFHSCHFHLTVPAINSAMFFLESRKIYFPTTLRMQFFESNLSKIERQKTHHKSNESTNFSGHTTVSTHANHGLVIQLYDPMLI